jgi:hypothetical protein
MSARSIRRAAERKAERLVAKAGIRSQPTAPTAAQPAAQSTAAAAGCAFSEAQPEPEPQPSLSDARLTANRANAKLSTGATTAAGRAKSSMNAFKTGLTGQTVLLPTDDLAAYQQHLDHHFKQFAPATGDEKSLVQTIADTAWRLLRIVPLESSIWAVARIKLADLYPDVADSAIRAALIDGEILLAYHKNLSNLALQERRLYNQRATVVAQLETLQNERREKQAADQKRALAVYKSTRKLEIPFDPSFFGFVFSIDELEQHATREQALAFAQGLPSDLTKDQFVALMAQCRQSNAA